MLLSYNNQFEKIIFDGLINVTEFSNAVHLVGIESFSNITSGSDSVKFQVQSRPVFVNGEMVDFNDSYFIVKLENDNYIISNDEIDLTVSYDVIANSFYIQTPMTNKSYDILTDIDIDSDFNLLYYPVYVAILEDLVIENSLINRTPAPTFSPRYQGTGIGFHKDRSSADYFCNRDKNKILSNNPTWCTPGVTVSCLWDNHLCVCTAEYYSGSECDSVQ